MMNTKGKRDLDCAGEKGNPASLLYPDGRNSSSLVVKDKPRSPKSHFLSTAGKKNTDTRLNRDKALMKNVRDTSVIFYMTVGVNAAGTANKSHQTLFCYKTAETQRRQSRQMTVTDAASSTCSNCRRNQGHFLVRLTFFAFKWFLRASFKNASKHDHIYCFLG